MKKLIRNSTFETNSSSTHSVSIDENVSVYDSIELDENNNIEIPMLEFGWSFEKYKNQLVNYLT